MPAKSAVAGAVAARLRSTLLLPLYSHCRNVTVAKRAQMCSRTSAPTDSISNIASAQHLLDANQKRGKGKKGGKWGEKFTTVAGCGWEGVAGSLPTCGAMVEA